MPGPSTAAPIRWARVAITAIFFVHGLVFASWVAHIPHVKSALHLGDGALGLALLGAPLGSVLAMVVVGRALPHHDSRTVVQVALVGYCAAGPVVGLSGSFGAFFAVFLVRGAFQGALDVAMNTQGLTVETAARRVLMPGFHGWWSIGSMAGAGLGAAGVALGLTLSVQLLVVAAPCLAVAGWLTTRLLPDPGVPVPAHGRSGGSVLRPAVLVLGAIALADMLCEGAVADWAAVYLRDSLRTAAAVAALGYTAFSLAMVVVRLSGNRLLSRFSSRLVVPALAAPAAVGLASSLLVGGSAAFFVGLVLLGCGLASVVPVCFRAAGSLPGLDPGRAVAAVAGFGWAGFVFGPPVIGAVAQAASLRVALGLVPLLTAAVAVTAFVSEPFRRT